MAGDDAVPMHEEFARWYDTVSMDDNPRRRQARWEGVSSVVRSANRNTVEALLRLVHRSRQVPAATVQEIRLVFKSTDDAFEMTGNDQELRILAGACLAVLMETDAHTGAVAALAATTAALGSARQPGLPMDLAALGEVAIIRWGDANRRRPSLSIHLSDERPKFDFEKASAKVMEEPNWEGVAEAFKLAANTTRGAMKRLAQTQTNTLRTVDNFLRVQDEELQMLWWLTGRRSSDCNCAFDAIPADARPLVLASELADKTEFLPGPPSVMGILSRAGLKERERVQITVAVNAADSGWLQRLISELDPSPVSTPLHAAIKRQLETGTGEAWVAGWAASTGVDAAHELSGLVLGNLFYRERLLLLFD